MVYAVDQQSHALLSTSSWATLFCVCLTIKPGVLGSPHSSWSQLSCCYFCLCHGCGHHYPLSPLLRLLSLLLAPLPIFIRQQIFLCQGISLQSPLPSLDSPAQGNPICMNISVLNVRVTIDCLSAKRLCAQVQSLDNHFVYLSIALWIIREPGWEPCAVHCSIMLQTGSVKSGWGRFALSCFQTEQQNLRMSWRH